MHRQVSPFHDVLSTLTFNTKEKFELLSVYNAVTINASPLKDRIRTSAGASNRRLGRTRGATRGEHVSALVRGISRPSPRRINQAAARKPRGLINIPGSHWA